MTWRWLRRGWALVTRDSHGCAAVVSEHYTERGAVRVMAEINRHRRTWNGSPRVDLEPTDWGPGLQRRLRVVQVLMERGAVSAVTLSRYTAMSPWCVEQVLLELGRRRFVVHRVLAAAGEDGRTDPGGVWRLRTPEELAADQHKQER